MLTLDPEKIASELKAHPQWVCWGLGKREGKPTKVPKNPKSGGNAKADNPATWGTYPQALKQYEAHKDNGIAGIGYMFSADDPYTGTDIDHCRAPKTGQLKYCAQVLIEYLDSYSEASPSGTGFHTIAKAEWPVNAGNKKKMPCGMEIEIYDRLRYFTMTGHHLEGTPTIIEDRQAQLTALHTLIFSKPQTPLKSPRPGGPELELSDRELIEKAQQAADGEKFGRLWRGDISGYPTPSHADYALIHLLVFWTNKDPERIDRLFRQSGLCQDPERLKKWERLADKTIAKAIANTPEGYEPSKAKRNSQNGPEPKASSGAHGAKTGTSKIALKTITARELGSKEFPPRRWTVPDLITEGLTILAGRPKLGKSMLALNVAGAVATGGVALGKIPVEQGESLYLALEDSERRMKERLERLFPCGELPEGLHIATVGGFPPLHKGGLAALDAWLSEHPQARLVIVDTLARVKSTRKRNQDAYNHDAEIIASLQAIAFKYSVAIIVIHHTTKLESDDFLMAVSGTYGLTGAADCVAVLARKGRGEMDGTLKLTGRDIEEKELALRFSPDLCLWELLGDSKEFGRSKERQDILIILKENGPLYPRQIADIMGKTDKKDKDKIKALLWKMKVDGDLSVKEGRYSVPSF